MAEISSQPSMPPTAIPTESDYSLFSEQIRIASIFIMFSTSFLGVILPLWYFGSGDPSNQRKISESDSFRIIRSFAAGIMMGVAFIHLLAEGVASLNEACPDYPALGYTLSTVGAMMVLGFEQIAVALIGQIKTEQASNFIVPTNEGNCPVAEGGIETGGLVCEAGGGHPADAPDASKELEVIASHTEHSPVCEHAHAINMIAGSDATSVLVKAYMMEASVAVHSIILGLDLGSMSGVSNLPTLQALLIAVCFHQFFEGLGLGSTIQEARLELGKSKVLFFVLTFAMTVSIGVTIGFLLDKYPMTNKDPDASERDSNFVTGILNSLCSGVLIYVSLVEMVAEDFQAAVIATRFGLKAKMLLSLMCGTLIMAILAIWG